MKSEFYLDHQCDGESSWSIQVVLNAEDGWGSLLVFSSVYLGATFGWFMCLRVLDAKPTV